MIKKILVVMLLGIVTVQAAETRITEVTSGDFEILSAREIMLVKIAQCKRGSKGIPPFYLFRRLESHSHAALLACTQAVGDVVAQEMMLRLHEAFKQAYDWQVNEQGFLSGCSTHHCAPPECNTQAGQIHLYLMQWEKVLENHNRKIVVTENVCSIEDVATSKTFVSIIRDDV